MKKFLVFLAVVSLAAGMSFAQSSADKSIGFSVTVDKYIETMAAPIDWNLGVTLHAGNREGINTAVPQGNGWGEWNIAYSNCPFSVSISGDNPAGQHVPRFARAEVGDHAAGGFDILSTAFQIGVLTNGVWDNQFGLNYGVRAGEFIPKTVNFSEAPHNGQVKIKIAAKVNDPGDPNEISAGYPIRETLINSAFTNIQSADAGVYTCTMVITLTAL